MQLFTFSYPRLTPKAVGDHVILSTPKPVSGDCKEERASCISLDIPVTSGFAFGLHDVKTMLHCLEQLQITTVFEQLILQSCDALQCNSSGGLEAEEQEIISRSNH